MGINANAIDQQWMRYAIRLAQRAEATGEVPVGAVLIKGDSCLAEGFNTPISRHDPTAHAEIVAIRQAGLITQNYRLAETTLYVTLEPCIMCIGAIYHARIQRLVFGAFDNRHDATRFPSFSQKHESIFDNSSDTGCRTSHLLELEANFNHKVHWQGGVLADSCSHLLKTFFKARRGNIN